tara:strand:+ start:1352 stop:1612 length:261 start_codon:yes stop_codon:yes gene_type:complete
MEIYVTVRAGEGVVNILCQGIQKDELVEQNVVLVGCKDFSLNMDDTSSFSAEHVSIRSADVLSYVTGTVQGAAPEQQAAPEAGQEQ